VVVDRTANQPYAPQQSRIIQPDIYARAEKMTPTKPLGVRGDGAIAFGGGGILTRKAREQIELVDPVILIPTAE
jgi:hypothetical protein